MWVKIPQVGVKFTLFSYALPSPINEVLVVGLCTTTSSFWVNMPQQTFSAAMPAFQHYPYGALGDGSWHLLSFSSQPGDQSQNHRQNYVQLKYYIDGNLVRWVKWIYTGPLITPSDGGSVMLGQGQSTKDTIHHLYDTPHSSWNSPYSFFMTEVRFWNRMLTQSQIRASRLLRLLPPPSRAFPLSILRPKITRLVPTCKPEAT